MSGDKKDRRPRGTSPRGDFETAKVFATSSEEERVAAAKRKTEALRALVSAPIISLNAHKAHSNHHRTDRSGPEAFQFIWRC